MSKPNSDFQKSKTQHTKTRPNKSKGYKTSRSNDGKKEYAGSETPDHNDWSFYAASEQIVKDVASIPFNYLGGTNFPLTGSFINSDVTTSISNIGALPAVMSVKYVSSIGVTSKATDAVNMAAVQLYTKVRQSNSGARNYEAPDIMMYVLAMYDVYSAIAEIKKIYGMAGLFNYYNHNLPDMLCHSSAVDATDLRAKLAQYRAQINLLIRKINSFAVPKYFKIFNRAAYINAFIFSDSDSIRGQLYNFSRMGYYTWSGTSSETGTSLVYKDYSATDAVQTFDVRINALRDMLDAIFLDEDALTMSGDILKAFSDGELYQVSELADNYVVPIVKDDDILAQIENMHCVSVWQNVSNIRKGWSLNITQSGQLINYKPKQVLSIGASSLLSLDSLVLNSHKDSPDAKDVIEWTRLMATYTGSVTGQATTVEVTSCGLELPIYCTSYRYLANGTINTTIFGSDLISVSPTPMAYQIKTLCETSNYDWHPTLYVYVATDGQYLPFADLKVATVITLDQLRLINEAAVYGAFYKA